MLPTVLAAWDPRIVAAIIAAGVSLVVTLATVLLTPLFRWGVERDLNHRQATYAEELEELREKHRRSLERQRQEHAHALQRLEAEAQRERGREKAEADLDLARRKADIEYEMEQRKALRQSVGSYRGRLIDAGNSLNYRLDNLRENRTEIVGSESSEKWLDVRGNYERGNYYFVSMIYRFMAFAAVANRFERAAIFVDPRYAEPGDHEVVFYVRALRWVLTDLKLFAGVDPPYQSDPATDHFFTDDIRRMCAVMTDDDGQLVEMDEVALEPTGVLEPVLWFFDGLRADALKWDRLMAFALLLKAFLNTISYEQVKSTQEDFDVTASSIRRPAIRENLIEWLPRLAIERGEPAAMMRLAVKNAGVAEGASEQHLIPPMNGPEPRA